MKYRYENLYDYTDLLERIKLLGLTQDAVARKIGIDPATFSQKIHGKSLFTQLEMDETCRVLNIEPSKVHIYFLKRKLLKN